MTQVLVLTTEPLPLPGSVTTGAGLRAWGLAEGLRSSGLDVAIGTPVHGDHDPAPPPPGFNHVHYFRRNAIAWLLEKVQPACVVLQHWGLAAEVPELTVPLAIDLAGPHLLERKYWGNPDPERDLQEKLAALRRADFVTCSGLYQRHYFYPFLQMSGYDITKLDVPVIPFSVPPRNSNELPRSSQGELTFIYGGAFLAWQDPTRAIAWLLQEMDDADTGRLLFYGGSHPVIDASGGRFTQLVDVLSNHPRVEVRGWKPFEELVREYRLEGDVALDLMSRNPERQLAFTTRTMIYMYCGLPVIYNDYAELSPMIANAGAGWALNPDDEDGFRNLVRRILSGNEPVAEPGARARELAAKFEWTKTIAPLANFCRNPKQREGRVEFALAHEHSRLQQHIASAAPSVSLLRRLAMTVRPARIAAPFVYAASWPLVLYIWLRLRRTIAHS